MGLRRIGLLTLIFSASAAASPGPRPAPAPFGERFDALARALGSDAAAASRARAVWERAEPALASARAEERALFDEGTRAFLDGERSACAALSEDPVCGRRWSSDPARRDRARRAFGESEAAVDRAAARLQAVRARIRELERRRDAEIASGVPATLRPAFDAAAERARKDREARRVYEHLAFLSAHPANDADRDAAAARERAQGWASSLAAALKARDRAALRGLLADGATSPSWSSWAAAADDGAIREERLAASPRLTREEAARSIEALLGRFRSIEAAELAVFSARPDGDAIRFFGRLSVRGASRGGRQEFSAELEGRLDGSAAPRLAGIDRLRGRLVAAVRGPLFEERTRPAGLEAVPVELRREAIRRGGYALAAADYDGDGAVDLYVGAEGPGRLLKGGPGGRFRDVTAQAGLETDRLVKAAVFADFNDDGVQDLMLVRFEYAADEQVRLYEGLPGGRFRVARGFELKGFSDTKYSLPMPIAVGDYDGDGRLDVYIGFPGKQDFTTLAYEDGSLARDPRLRRRGGPEALFLNRGGFRFEDHTRDGLYAFGATRRLFPHAAVAADIDGDGRQDLVVVDDRRNPNPVYHNEGAGRFRQVAERIGMLNPQSGMSVAVGDYNNDGRPDLFMTNIHLMPEFASAPGAWLFGPSSLASANLPGNRLYLNRGDGTFADATDEAGVRFGGAAAGGAAFFDYDNDGDLDLLMVNGLWSAGARSFDETYADSQRALTLSKELRARAGVSPGINPRLWEDERLEAIHGGGQVVMQILQDLRDPDGGPALSFGGWQRNRLYRNNGDGTFTDVAYAAGLDSIHDGYVAALSDVDRDGAVDVLLRNADPGTPEHVFPPVQLWRNLAGRRRPQLALRLEGRSGNRDAIGARATLRAADGRLQTRELIANNGAAQDERELVFGLGSARSAGSLEVRWLSGAVQRFPDVAAGRYVLREGEALRPDIPAGLKARRPE